MQCLLRCWHCCATLSTHTHAVKLGLVLAANVWLVVRTQSVKELSRGRGMWASLLDQVPCRLLNACLIECVLLA
jgi:hypothetical protein